MIRPVDGRASIDVQDMEETNERRSRHGARKGDFRGILGVQGSCELLMGGSTSVMWTSITGDGGGVGSKSAVAPTCVSDFANRVSIAG